MNSFKSKKILHFTFLSAILDPLFWIFYYKFINQWFFSKTWIRC